ncbi:MAG: hypothetical protein EOM12_08245 [Verrucomicrobiae bacterium]|nr:hypothetical protein [Verrucomicrobiae bacterium]
MKKEWGITITYAFLFLGAGMAAYLGLWYMPSKISEHGVILWNELALPNEAKEVFTSSLELFKGPWNVVGWIGVVVFILGFVLFYFDKIKIDKLSKFNKILYSNITELFVIASLFFISFGIILGEELVNAAERSLIKTLSKDFSIQIKTVVQHTYYFMEQWCYILPSGIILLFTSVIIFIRFRRIRKNFNTEKYIKIKDNLVFIFIIIFITSFNLIVPFLAQSELRNNTLTIRSKLNMLLYLDRWSEEGKPEGKKLDEFMREGRFNIVQTNREFVIDGTNVISKFASLRDPGKTLFATTNILFWVSLSGEIIGEPEEWKYENKTTGDSEKLNEE